MQLNPPGGIISHMAKAKRSAPKTNRQAVALVDERAECGELIRRETNISVLPERGVTMTISKDDDDVFPSKALLDALTEIEYTSLKDFITGLSQPENAIRTSNMDATASIAGNGNGHSGGVSDRSRANYNRSVWIFEQLAMPHQEEIRRFCRMYHLDVGESTKRRKQASLMIQKIGSALIVRQDKARSVSGYVGYMKAVSQCVVDLEIKYDIWTRRARENKKRAYEKRLREIRAEQIDSAVQALRG